MSSTAYPTPARVVPAMARGRGAGNNPHNRFERLEVVSEEPTVLKTTVLKTAVLKTTVIDDTSRTIISRNDSPDIPFDRSINPYRGCEHGCAYCYARPSHEFLGFSAGLDFESRILVKRQAAELLERELSGRSWQPQLLAMSGVTDPYQPIERQLEITRSCLQVLAAMRQPVGIVTKGPLVTRDLDLLAELAEHSAASVSISITTLDADLAAALEPRAGHPRRRLEAIRQLSTAGIPVGVLSAPIIPGLNDHEVAGILEAAAEAGASFAGYTLLRLPGVVAELFDDWLQRHAPDRRERVLHRVRETRDGQINDSRFGHRMRGKGRYAQQIADLFGLAARKHGLNRGAPALSTEAFRPPRQQLSLAF